jgi:hypothetical protein
LDKLEERLTGGWGGHDKQDFDPGYLRKDRPKREAKVERLPLILFLLGQLASFELPSEAITDRLVKKKKKSKLWISRS